MISTDTFTFLNSLDKNNNREWFNDHKPDFQRAKDNIAAFTGYLIGEISRFDANVSDVMPADCIFRIYRDVRFAKDKSPYKNNLGAYIAPGGRKSTVPGYYIHFQPGQSFVAAGKYRPNSGELLKIRNVIANRTSEFTKIVEAKSYKDRFGELHGERLKTTPKGFAADSAAIEYLKLKSFTAFCEYGDDDMVTGKDFPKLVVKDLKAMYPLVAFLRGALEE